MVLTPPEEAEISVQDSKRPAGRPKSEFAVTAEVILLDFLEQFEGLIDRFHAAGPEVMVSEWTRRSSFASGSLKG